MIALGGLLSSGLSFIGNVFGGKSDAEITAIGQQDAQQQLACALRGDVLAARTMVYGRDKSTRQGIRDAYAQAWQQLLQQRPDVAAAAEAAGGVSLDDSNRNCAARNSGLLPLPTSPSSSNPLQQAAQAIGDSVQQGIDNVRSTAAQEVQQLGAGLTSAATNAVAPSNASGFALTIPTNSNTLLIILVVAAVVMLLLLERRQ